MPPHPRAHPPPRATASHPRRALRWSPASAAFGSLVLLAPAGVIPAVAGLALLTVLASSLQAALADADERVPAVVTFVTAASGIAIAGVSAAFWALVAGLVVRWVLRSGRPST